MVRLGSTVRSCEEGANEEENVGCGTTSESSRKRARRESSRTKSRIPVESTLSPFVPAPFPPLETLADPPAPQGFSGLFAP